MNLTDHASVPNHAPNHIKTPIFPSMDITDILDKMAETQAFLCSVAIQDFDMSTSTYDIKSELQHYQKNLIETAMKIIDDFNKESSSQ